MTINNSAPRLAGGQKWSYKPLRVGFNPQGAYQFLAHMKQILVSIFIFLSACGIPRTHESHSDFNKYKERFEQETGVRVSVPIIYDANLSNEFAAVCEIFSDGYKLIRINELYWSYYGESAREELVYHELGHCVLDRDHSEELTIPPAYSYAIPNSIMYPYAFGNSFYYLIFRDHYVEELMHPGKRLGN